MVDFPAFTETPFTGYEGTWVSVPPRNVVPKPKQKPHPPLWVACSARDTIDKAARGGVGALSFSFISFDEAKEWVESYYRVLASDECVPIGRAVNPNFSVVLPFMCAPDEQTALDRGLDGARFFAHSFMHYFMLGEHTPGHTDLGEGFAQMRAMMEMASSGETEMDPAMVAQIDSLRRGIGSPEQLREVIRGYEAAGVDQIIFQAQIGNNKHEHIMEALELFAREVMPEFVERRPAIEAAKAERLAGPICEALSRIEIPVKDVSDYVIMPEMEGVELDEEQSQQVGALNVP